MDNTQQIEIMIYRNNQLDKIYALRTILRRSGRVLGHYTAKALSHALNGLDELVNEFKKL